jgi:hypothetical protein
MLCSKRVILTLKEAEAMLEKELKYFEDHKEELLKHYENSLCLLRTISLLALSPQKRRPTLLGLRSSAISLFSLRESPGTKK